MSKNKNSKNPRNSRSFENVLITGGCGFIGVNLVNYLLSRGFGYIRILDNLSTGTKENLEDALQDCGEVISKQSNDKIIYKFKSKNKINLINNMTIDLIVDDVRSYEMCLKATEDIDVVVHLAASAGVLASIEDPFHDFEVNVRGTLNLLSASVKNHVDKFVFASSNATLGDQSPPMSEQKVPKPLSPYGASKLACEGYCSAFYRSYGLKTVSLRFSNAYGPHSLHKKSVVAQFLKDATTKRMLIIYGDGTQTRDFIYVTDICSLIAQIIKSKSPKIYGEYFNLGTGRETQIIDLGEFVRKLFKDEIQVLFQQQRKGEIKRNYSDIGKAKAMLGFEPLINLKDGIKQVYEWFMNQGIDRIREHRVVSGSE